MWLFGQSNESVPIKKFSLGAYWRKVQDGYNILYDEFRLLIGRPRSKEAQPDPELVAITISNFQPLSAVSPHHDLHPAAVEDATRSTGLSYGFGVYSSLSSLFLLFSPAHLLDMRQHSIPSRTFAWFHYIMTIVSIVFSIYSIHISNPYIRRVQLNFINLNSTFSLTVNYSESAYHSFNFICASYLIYNRKFLLDFLLYKCSVISLPVNFQRRQMVWLFIVLNLLTCISEPLFVALTLYADLKQPIMWPNLDPDVFVVCRWVAIVWSGLGASFSSAIGMQIPMMTIFFIICSCEHVDLILRRQFHRFGLKFSHERLAEVQEDELVQLINAQTRNIMADFSCSTLSRAWPQILEIDGVSPLANHNNMSTGSMKAQRFGDDRHPTRLAHSARPIQTTSSEANTTLFIYKNLLKCLTELKDLIEIYERYLGGFHMVHVLVNGFNVSQWATASFFAHNSSSSESSAPMIFEFKLRVLLRLVTFAASLFYFFLRCDCLASQLTKVRSRLFRFNVDLARSSGGKCAGSKAGGSSLSIVVDQLELNSSSLSASELEQIWLLYDQVERLSHFAHFKFSNKTHYDKRCLILIVGRFGSLVLFTIQLVDMYRQT